MWQSYLNGLLVAFGLIMAIGTQNAFVLAQSLWMGLFVEMITGGLPGDLVIKLALLVLASAAMTAATGSGRCSR